MSCCPSANNRSNAKRSDCRSCLGNAAPARDKSGEPFEQRATISPYQHKRATRFPLFALRSPPNFIRPVQTPLAGFRRMAFAAFRRATHAITIEVDLVAPPLPSLADRTGRAYFGGDELAACPSICWNARPPIPVPSPHPHKRPTSRLRGALRFREKINRSNRRQGTRAAASTYVSVELDNRRDRDYGALLVANVTSWNPAAEPALPRLRALHRRFSFCTPLLSRDSIFSASGRWCSGLQHRRWTRPSRSSYVAERTYHTWRRARACGSIPSTSSQTMDQSAQ